MLMTMVAVGATAAATLPTSAQELRAGFRAVAGYQNLDLDYEFFHDTHPDDFSLPNATVPGSAGPTHLGRLNLAAIGVGYEAPLGRSFSFNVDVGGLLGGDRVTERAANDIDPDSPNLLYSEARYGFFAAAGVAYHIKKFYVGAGAQLAGLYVDDGWVRSGHDQSQHSGMELVPTGGPKIGYMFDEEWSLEATAQFGHSVSFGVQVRWRF